MPFRSARQQQVIERPETGAVAEMVRQFADPYAFVRELVQNSIDAGAKSLEVRVERAGAIATTALHDDGVGMTRETIDGPLLTLFNSSKEGDSTKIGKYGVGFVSVFAIDPEIVEVDTWRDGQHHRIRLFRDHRYEIEKLEPLDHSGTVVTLHQTMDAATFDEHRRRIEMALSRWCRFAAVPIEFISVDHDRNDSQATRRIDRPLTVPSSLYVQAHREKERFVVGPSAGTQHFSIAGATDDDPANNKPTFAGFYNRGLTLFETDEPLHASLANVRVRVDSPHLKHTLSRDNVLRDKNFDRIIAKTRELVQKSLRRELTSRLTRAARGLVESKPPYDAELIASYVAFLEAALEPPLSIAHDEIMFPLAAPWKKSSLISFKTIMTYRGMYITATPNELAAAVTKAGYPVLLAPDAAIHSLLALQIPLPGPITPEKNFCLLKEVPEKEMSSTDKALCLSLENHFLALGIMLRPVTLATPDAKLDAPCVLAQKPTRYIREHVWLSPKEFAENGWSQDRADGGLILNTAHEAVQSARKHAEKDTFLAAHILLRLLLLSRPDPHGKLSDALFSIAAVEVV